MVYSLMSKTVAGFPIFNFLLIPALALAAGCAAPKHTHETPPAPGLYLTYYKNIFNYGVNNGVVGPVTDSSQPFYYYHSDNNGVEQISVRKISEDTAKVGVAFNFWFSGGHVQLEKFDSSKTGTTRIMLYDGIQVTGRYQK